MKKLTNEDNTHLGIKKVKILFYCICYFCYSCAEFGTTRSAKFQVGQQKCFDL